MKKNWQQGNHLFGMLLCILFTGCGIASYPGQPGVKTNGNSRLDYEILDEDGLWIYEASYDNSKNGRGVESITTRLYPNVYTYSSNARSNGHGTFYRHKLPYRGSSIQMISFPMEKKIYLPEDSRVLLMVDFLDSVDEVDDRNLSEEGLFEKPIAKISEQALKNISNRLDLLKAAKLSANGALNFEIDKITLDGLEYNFAENPILQSNIVQSGIHIQLSKTEKKKFMEWLEIEFPSGFAGTVTAWVNGGNRISRNMSINTINTITQNGFEIVTSMDIKNQKN